MEVLKKATCSSTVPKVLSPTGAEITVGTILEYSRVVFRNGEHHLVLGDNKKQVPAVFFVC